MRSEPLAARTLSDSLVGALRSRILAGEFPSRTRLSDVELAESYGVSRATTRAALQQLCHEGVVVAHPHRGFFVSDVSPSDVVDLLTLRGLLEGRAAAIAVRRLTDDDFARLEEIVDLIARRDYQQDIAQIRELDVVFHGLIADRSEKPILIELWSALNSRLYLMEHVCRDILRLTSESSGLRHQEYIDSLRERDPDRARRAAEAHYHYYLDLLTRVPENDGASPLDQHWRAALTRHAVDDLEARGRAADDG